MHNLETIKKEFAGLAEFLNAFKSESVQLRILDYILHGSSPEPADQAKKPHSKVATKPRTKNPIVARSTAKEGRQARKGRPGPGAILDQLLQAGFFKQKRTIADIMSHMGSKLGRHFKPNELSTPLVRFVRDNKLDREKNAENQFEYLQK